MTGVAIAAPHKAAVEAAEAAVRNGGNAVDAALAAAITLTVVYPHQCSLGGDLVALLHLPDGTVQAILSIGAAPAEALPLDEIPRQGAMSVTVPGVVAGWQSLAGNATLPLAEPLRYAAGLARDGVAVSPGLAHAVEDRWDAVQADRGLRDLLLDDGRIRTVLQQPQLAETLAKLATGPGEFYQGTIAAQLADFLRRGGSLMSTEDFARHEAELAEPLALDLPDGRWYAAPPPTQGVVLLAVLASTPADGLVELCRRAAATRDRLLGDPKAGPIDVAALLRAEEPAPASVSSRAAGDTVAVTAVGEDGLAVSLIQSVYQSFGAGICDPATGIVLHNRGAAFSLESGHPAEFGPGRRPPHTLCPVIGRSADVLLAAGCQGGRAQPQILAQTVPELLRLDTDPARTLARPRWVVGARDIGYETETVLAEPGSRRGAASSTDPAPVAVTAGPVDEAGHVQVARLVRETLDAASDPRADGGAAVLAKQEELQ
jgi:oxamate amidohydrolase